MEGPIKAAVSASLHLEMHGRAQGSSALAQLIVGGSIRPDVFIPVTAGPMMTVLRGGKAQSAEPLRIRKWLSLIAPSADLLLSLKRPPKGKVN
jgi:molybdate/tungstate transport system substrate-binding protein